MALPRRNTWCKRKDCPTRHGGLVRTIHMWQEPLTMARRLAHASDNVACVGRTEHTVTGLMVLAAPIPNRSLPNPSLPFRNFTPSPIPNPPKPSNTLTSRSVRYKKQMVLYPLIGNHLEFFGHSKFHLEY